MERRHRGFSLLEALMVVALMLMTGVLAVAGAMSTSVIGSKNSRDIVHLTSGIRQKMEELKSSDYDSIANGSDYLDVDGVPQSSSTDAGFSRTWTVTADSPSTGMPEITVSATVVLTYGQTQPITFTARTYRAP